MLKRMVPTPITLLVPPIGAGGFAFASMTKPSRSGSVNGTAAFQLLVGRSSFQVLEGGSYFTISPTGGLGVGYWDSLGSVGKLPLTAFCPIAVVRLPEWNTAA